MMKLTDYLIVRMGRPMRDSIAVQVIADDDLYSELLLLIQAGNQTQRMKGSWVLAGIHRMDAGRVAPKYSTLIDCLRTETVGGVKREILRCFEGCSLSDEIAGELVAITMNWVTDETQDLAVRYLCYRLLKPLIRQHRELQLELNTQVELYKSKFGRFP
jgi:hypothetical protein